MSNFHPNFPFGKGMWVHDIGSVAPLKKDSSGELAALSKFDDQGNLLYKATFDDIIKKLTDNDFSYVLIKIGDGNALYPGGQSQLTRDMVDACHAAGLKVYSWSYVYGADPSREGDLVLYAVEQLGVDGHVFDAEIEYERLPNPSAAAETMLQVVRTKYPDFFLAHAPFPIIDYHTAFPYATFGKYCDAVMPQVYWNDIGVSVSDMIAEMFQQWSKWQDNWTASGHGDSVKPIVPLGMSYDITDRTPALIMTPEELTEFITGVAGYMSVCFWVMEYTIRDDLWNALKSTPVKAPPADPSTQQTNQNTQQTQSSTTQPQVPAQPQQPAQPANPPAPAQQTQTVPTSTPTSTPSTPTPPATPATTQSVTPQKPAVAQSTPFTPPAVINVKKDNTSPSGVSMQVRDFKPHIDYLIEFFQYLFTVLIPKFFGKKGGDGK